MKLKIWSSDGLEGECEVCGDSERYTYRPRRGLHEVDEGEVGLKRRQVLPEGEIYDCEKCGQPWFIDSRWAYTYRVSLQHLYQEWTRRDLSATRFEERLQKIKASPKIGHENYLLFPVKAAWATGSSERCLLYLIEHPLVWYCRDFFEDHDWQWLSDIVQIESSTQTLSDELRIATYHAEEVFRDRWPTDLLFKKQHLITVDGPHNFAIFVDTVGADYELAPKELGKSTLISDTGTKTTVIFGRYEPRLEELRLP